MEMQFSLHELLADKQEGESIIQASQSLESLVDKRDSLNLRPRRAEAVSQNPAIASLIPSPGGQVLYT